MSAITIKSKSFDAYLKYTDGKPEYGNVSFYGVRPGSSAKFVIKPVDPPPFPNSVRIQCCHNTMFLTRVIQSSGWLTPVADEDQGDVFEKIHVKENQFRFRHVQLRRYAYAKRDDSGDQTVRFFVGSELETEQGIMEICDFPVSEEETTSKVGETK